jgi:hypothetical protein
MIKKILITALVCTIITACSTPKEMEPDLSQELISLLNKKNVPIELNGHSFTPKGKLVLKVKGSDLFLDNATITIPQNYFENLDEVADTIHSMVNESKSNDRLPIEAIDLDLFQ